MYSNKPFFDSWNWSRKINKIVRPLIEYLLLVLLFVIFFRILYLVGFEKHIKSSNIDFFRLMFSVISMIYLFRAFICIGFRSFTYDFFLYLVIGSLLLFAFALNVDRNIEWLNGYYFYSIVSFLLFIFEFSRFDLRNITLVLNPAQLFMFSFAFFILVGAALLMLPNATTAPISFINALFTSTSAICVTGLTVVDISTEYTALGKSIILLLIQVGGIGIMTFTSFFGFFFKGGTSSFSERFALSDFLSEDNVSQIRKTLAKVIFITFLIEGIGAAIIYFNLNPEFFHGFSSKLKFSVFHSVSAFCNAGFSTLSEGLQDMRVQHTYSILYTIAGLIILGGIGFPILLNFYTYLKFKLLSLLSLLRFGQRKDYIPQMININSRLVIYTTLFLIITGTVFFFLFENHSSLEGMDLSGKIAHSFFGSVTPRTAGFNSVNMAGLTVATVVLTIFLMWVGASPVSTGGGIKTTTFAIAILNVMRIARIRNHIEFHKREIHERSVDRAFAIIILSIIILGCSSLIMYLIEKDKSPLYILFECVSAFSTVGLSMKITPLLTDGSKLLLIFLMFMGRMGILTLLFALIRKTKNSVYRYPKQNVLIT